MNESNDRTSASTGNSVQGREGQLFRQMLDVPLYTPIGLDTASPNQDVRGARVYEAKYDHYCPQCKLTTPWKQQVSSTLIQAAKRDIQQSKLAGMVALSPGHSGSSVGPTQSNWMTPFELTTECLRGGHTATYHFVVEGPAFGTRYGEGAKTKPNGLVKVGQYPSLADFQLGDLTEFENLISKQQRLEFVRGINCTAHGFSVAACVYYRRVFEGILIEARNEHMLARGMALWPEFDIAHTDQRIKMLAEKLPKFLSDNPHLYGLLSLGVHKLTEEQCAEQLPLVRSAIELILRDRIAIVAAKKQREAIEKLLAQATNDHK